VGSPADLSERRVRTTRKRIPVKGSENPKDTAVVNALAWALSRLGQPPEALAHARPAVALAPDSAETLDTLGTILLQNGSAADAVYSLDEARKRSPTRPDI
jgi:Flp pilus assembly protein TadD